MKKWFAVVVLVVAGGYLAYSQGWLRTSKQPCQRLAQLCRSEDGVAAQYESYMAAGASVLGAEPSEAEKAVTAPPPARRGE